MDNKMSEIIKNIGKEGVKAFSGRMLTHWMDKRQFVNMFIDAGAAVANYERTGSEECELRDILFCEANMRALAESMYRIDDFSWWEKMQQWLHSHLENAAISDSNKKACERHFCELIEHSLKCVYPEVYGRSLLQEMREELAALGSQMETMTSAMEKTIACDEFLRELIRQREEAQQNVRQEHSESRQSGTGSAKPQAHEIPSWNLKHVHVEGILQSKEARKAEIASLTEQWSKEREAFPGWYILPKDLCEKLAVNSRDCGLLQSHEWMDEPSMLEFAYELVWRWEKSFYIYSRYEYSNIYAIWDKYLKWIKANPKEAADATKTEYMRKWFYIGQALLRIFREYGEDTEWNKVYKTLRPYEAYGTNGTTDLQLERAKLAYHHLDMPALRRELSRCQPKSSQFEQRLQVLGLHVECGEADAVIHQLRQLMEDVEVAAATAQSDTYRVGCMTLQACALQLLSLCIQGTHDYEDEYELYQGQIDEILHEMEAKTSLFDWDSWKNDTEKALLLWKVKKHDKSEPFDLNRESKIFFGGENYCGDAYSFFRVLDRLAIPLQCGYVTLLGALEQPFMEAVMEMDSTLGLFLLVRCNRSATLKNLVNRTYVMSLGNDEAGQLLGWLLNAAERNIEELHLGERRMDGSIAQHMYDNVPELLMRLMSRCPESYMERALFVFKKLMEDEELPLDYPIASLQVAIMKQISEKQKARMLGTMMETAICEHRMLHGKADGLDVFDFYFCKEDIADNRSLCSVDASVIENLLEPSEEAGYEWRTKITRLGVLDRLDLLTEEQQQQYAKLIWSHVSEQTNLPLLTNLCLWGYEKLPCPDKDKLALSVKGYFLNRKLRDSFDDGNGWSMTMGDIPYLDELTSLCENVERDYWKRDEVDCILDSILDYWDILYAKVTGQPFQDTVWDEYRYRVQKMLGGIAAVCGNVSSGVDQGRLDKLKRMLEQIDHLGHGISTKEAELVLGIKSDILMEIQAELCSADSGLTVGALKAAFLYITNHPDTTEAQGLLDDIFALLRYRKRPGLLSAVWTLHNLVYRECPIMQGKNAFILDGYLLELAGITRIDNESCNFSTKEILSIRAACAAAAYQLYYRNIAPSGAGVMLWKQLAGGEEANDVKNQWVTG